MNRWKCDHPGCTVSATGTGGAFGLIAIGWYVELGPVTLCPAHHPKSFREAERQAEAAQAALKIHDVLWDVAGQRPDGRYRSLGGLFDDDGQVDPQTQLLDEHRHTCSKCRRRGHFEADCTDGES